MQFGIGYFPTHDAMPPGAFARLVEERGHESLFFAEHTHIPASRESPYPGGGELPRKYIHTYDLFVALTAAAAATSKLRVGSGICLVIERDPITTAKEVASIDHLSGGPAGVRGGGGMEPRGDGQPRHRSPQAHARHEGAHRGDEGDLDPGGGELQRRVRVLRSHLVLAQAGPAPASPGAGGRSRARRSRIASWTSATPGFPTTGRPICSRGCRPSAPALTATST